MKRPASSEGKVESFAEVLKAANAARKRGLVIVSTNGCFDLVHVGHVHSLEAAKKHGDVLIVGINSDASVRANKGPKRPIITARERAKLIASLKPVDHVFIFGDKTTDAWIKKLRPHVHVKAEDVKRHPDHPSQKRALAAAGGKFAYITLKKGRSTSAIIEKIRSI